MRVERLVFPIARGIANRPRMANVVFRMTKWGNPFAEERFTYPYPMYDVMRADGPVVFSKAYRQWFVFGYDEIHEVMRSPDVSTSGLVNVLLEIPPYTKLSPLTKSSFTRWLLTNDPPIHTRLRAAVSRAFTPKRIAGWEPQVRAVVAGLIADMAGKPSVDIVADFTARLPIYVIADLLGLPRDRWDWLRASSAEIGGLLEAFSSFDPVSMNQRFADLHEYFSELIADRRAAPTDDLISALAATDDGTELDNDEIIAMIGLLMFAGHETTTGLLGNSIVALAQHPSQRALLRTNPELIDNAVEELLRFDPPAQTSARVSTAPLQVGGIKVPAGATLALMIGAANRDTRRWPDANDLRLDRPDPKSISFGHGIHHCLGASLARLETKIALPAFLDAFGDYTLDLEHATWKRSHTLRGPLSLTVRRAVRPSVSPVGTA